MNFEDVIAAMRSEYKDGPCPDGNCRSCQIKRMVYSSPTANLVLANMIDYMMQNKDAHVVIDAMALGFEICERLNEARELEKITK